MKSTGWPTFVREKIFDKEIKRIAGSYSRMHELDLAIEWALGHDPKHFFNVKEDYYLWKTERLLADVPQLIILYKYIESENKVVFIAVSEIK